MSQYSLYVSPKPSYAWLTETSLTGPCPPCAPTSQGCTPSSAPGHRCFGSAHHPVLRPWHLVVGRPGGPRAQLDATGSSGPARGSEGWPTGTRRWTHVRACTEGRGKGCTQGAEDSWDVPPKSRAVDRSTCWLQESRIMAHQTRGAPEPKTSLMQRFGTSRDPHRPVWPLGHGCADGSWPA
jgi:hypothetical protein